jgi:uncharacterized protein YcbX
MARIQAIYRYPVKGLSAEPLPRTALTTGETVPGDRFYAIENGLSGFDPAAPSDCAFTPKHALRTWLRMDRIEAVWTPPLWAVERGWPEVAIH